MCVVHFRLLDLATVLVSILERMYKGVVCVHVQCVCVCVCVLISHTTHLYVKICLYIIYVCVRVCFYVCMCVCVRARVCLAVEVTWEDQQRGLNGSLSDGGTQPHPSLNDTGWSVVDF